MRISAGRMDRAKYKQLSDKRKAKVDKYQAEAAAWDAQATAYRTNFDKYTNFLIEELRKQFSDELKALGNVKIWIESQYTDNGKKGFERKEDLGSLVIHMAYYSEQISSMVHDRFGDNGRSKIHLEHTHVGKTWDAWHRSDWRLVNRGFSWKLQIYLHPDGSLFKTPVINAEALSSADYPVLGATYKLFAKVDSFDWEAFMQRTLNEAPNPEKDITENAPGELDTKSYDIQMKAQIISQFIGEDVWVRCKYAETANAAGEEKWFKFDSLNSTGKKVVAGTPSYRTKEYARKTDDTEAIARNLLLQMFNWEYRVGGFTFDDSITVLTSEELAEYIFQEEHRNNSEY